MAADERGIVIKVSADTTEFNANIKKLKNQSKLLAADLRKAYSTMDAKGLDGLNNAIKLNQQRIKVAEQKLSEYRAELSRLDDEDLGGDKWYNLQTEIRKTEAEIENANNKINQLNQKKLDLNADSANQELDSLGAKLQAVANKISQTISKMSASFTELGSKLRETGDKISGIGAKFMPLSAAIAGLGAVSTKMAGDTQDNIARLDAVFKKNSNEVQKWANTSSNAFLLSKNKAMEITGTYGNMATSMGLTTDEAADMSISLTKLVGDMKSFHGSTYTTEELSQSLMGVFTGEGEALEKLGVSMKVADLERYAATKGITKQYSEMSQAEQIQLRYNYVMQATKNVQGDAAKNAESFSTTMERLKAKFQDLGAKIGETFLPIVTKVALSIEKLVDKFMKMSPAMQRIVTIVGVVVAAIGPLIFVVGKVVSGFGLLAQVIGVLLTPVGAIGVAIAALVGSLGMLNAQQIGLQGSSNALVAIWQQLLLPALQGVWQFIQTNLVPILNTLWQVFQTSIMPAVAAFVNVIVTNVLPILQELWNAFESSILPVFNKVVNFIIANFIPTIMDLWKWFSQKIMPVITEMYMNLIQNLKPAFETIWEAISRVIDIVINLWNWFKANLLPIIMDLVTWLVSFLKPGFEAVSNVIGVAIGVVADIFNEITKFIDSALKVLDDTLGSVSNAFESAGRAVGRFGDWINGIWGDVKGFFGDVANGIAEFGDWLGIGSGGYGADFNVIHHGVDAGGYGVDAGGWSPNFNMTVNVNGTISEAQAKNTAKTMFEEFNKQLYLEGRRRRR